MCPSRHSCPLSGKLDKLEPQLLQRAERGDGLIHISGDHVVVREGSPGKQKKQPQDSEHV